MTSSLVGSEMCIRDSTNSLYLNRSPGPDQVIENGFVSRRNSDAVHGLWAVSYTHLTLPTICSV
eukprot:2477743-Prorocentrum_lima.AAC.1